MRTGPFARRTLSLLFGITLFAGVPASPASAEREAVPDRPSEEALRSVEATGRRIASYHEAIARAGERFATRGSNLAEGVRMVVVDRNGAWKVIVMSHIWGEPGAADWKMFAEIGFNPKAGEVTVIERFAPPRQVPSDALSALRAIDAASGTITLHVPEARAPFEEAVFKEKEKDQGYSVYLQPASEPGGAPRFGGDLLSKVSSDGMKVLKPMPLHGSAAWVPVTPSAKGEPTLHSHVEGDLPTETDVAIVIEHPELAPHLVLTPHHMFRIDRSGAITYLGPNEVPPARPGGAP